MWVVVALCALVALTALVLSVPVDLGLRVDVYGRPVAGVTFEWLFGRVKRSFRSGGKREDSARATTGQVQTSEENAKKKRRPPALGQSRFIVSIIRTRGLGQSLGRLLRRLVRHVRVTSVSADFRIGLDDPCDTALVVGTQSAAMMTVSKGRQFRLEPAFEGAPVLEGAAIVRIRLFPVTLLFPVLAFLLSPSTWRVFVTLIRWKIAHR